MSANERNPMKRTSSFSKREKMRRKPLSLRNSRSISVALLVNRVIVVPRMQSVGLRRDHRNHSQIEHQLLSFIAFVSPIHQHRKALAWLPTLPVSSPPMRSAS